MLLLATISGGVDLETGLVGLGTMGGAVLLLPTTGGVTVPAGLATAL